ncbi:MAG: phosphoribosylglycinamide formyltransferase [Sphingopyxis sp.]|nr:phosphoribosylglycinamide formyltransferase [Sphingopyxis sp.]
MKTPIAIFISGTGTNMAALLYASRAEDCPYEVVLVASSNPAAPGLTLAKAEGIATFAHPHTSLERAAHDAIMEQAALDAGAQYIALAGYMRLLSPEFAERWAGRMLNIHPSLLPKYKGLHTHQRALDAGDRHAGCSVHLVTAEVDAGDVLGQSAVAVLPGDTVEALSARVRIAEHQLYPRILSDWVRRENTPNYWLSRVREFAIAQPEADEITSHGMPCFGIIKGKKFAYFTHDHHGDGRTALLVKISGADEQAALIEQDGEMYFRPAYFGDDWVGIRLDLGRNDWDHIAGWITRSWRAVAPKKLAGRMDVAEEF